MTEIKCFLDKERACRGDCAMYAPSSTKHHTPCLLVRAASSLERTGKSLSRQSFPKSAPPPEVR